MPGLEVVKRLSVFEEICPSELDKEIDGHMQLSNFTGEFAADGLVASPAILTSQHSVGLRSHAEMNGEIDEDLVYPLPHTAINNLDYVEQKKHLASSNNPSTIAKFGMRNRKGKNRKFRRVSTVEVSH